MENLTPHDVDEDSAGHVIYCLLVSVLVLTQIFITVVMNKKIFDNFTNSNSISLFTVGQNTIWNAYGCLFHFFIAVNNEVISFNIGLYSSFWYSCFFIFY